MPRRFRQRLGPLQARHETAVSAVGDLVFVADAGQLPGERFQGIRRRVGIDIDKHRAKFRVLVRHCPAHAPKGGGGGDERLSLRVDGLPAARDKPQPCRLAAAQASQELHQCQHLQALGAGPLMKSASAPPAT